jgi:hypothetical protein
MQDPSISGDKQRAINEAVIVIAFTASGMRGAMLMQMTQALPVLAIDHARAPGGMAACDRSQYHEMWATIWLICPRTYKADTWRSSRISQSSNHVSHQDRLGHCSHSCSRLSSEQCPAKHTCHDMILEHVVDCSCSSRNTPQAGY